MNKFVCLNKKEVRQLVTVRDARLLMAHILRHNKDGARLSNPPRMVLSLNNDCADTYQIRAGYVKEIEKVGLRIGNLNNSDARYVLLIDAKSSQPLGLVNESETFKLRVGGTVANIIESLAKKDGSVVALIGAGKVARSVCLAIDELGVLKEVRVFDKYDEVKNSFVKDLKRKTQLKITPSLSVQEGVENADVVITVTTANEPLVERRWVKKGCLAISLGGGQELESQLVCEADKIVIDDMELCKSIGDIAYLIGHGLMAEHQIYGNLYEIFEGIKKGRENDSEIIVVVSQGIIAGDIALINFVYEQAVKRGFGKTGRL
ncbi:MAG: ornithine cyclodeaminase family protein [Deltaproteobacteria bacterium]|nr:ornithine cyclodeaminase family protein [Deltaproteobacteria bacterium]